jgi:hypothetical protein
MFKLNFPDYTFIIEDHDGREEIFDPARKKYVSLTPEEWVRQHVIQYLQREKKVPLSLISVETEIRLYKTRKRFDVAVFDRNGHPLLVVECKSPAVPVNQQVVDQVVRYNLALKVAYFMVTNGIRHICCQVDEVKNNIKIIDDIPDFISLMSQITKIQKS